MSLLLDAHALLWWLANDPALSEEATTAIADPGSAVLVSAATAWEISIKQALGKLDAPSDLERQIELNNFEPLSISVGHAYAAGTLQRHHDDPFDRMLVAQAMAERLTIVTRDSRIGLYGVPILST
ncbi:MAG: type II toxin-antitoxin system VapC family toxin [Actinobacteria bacterium]|jgi:PIN domain nuclease of toxin-antitoxin system|nr:type II toxin-antitoxin system VapC family toxin [Actinomycetota bacterium]MDQ3530851.1 type II toxin-antitoxin system VapC family toxin [Actinomycetota bacterium]